MLIQHGYRCSRSLTKSDLFPHSIPHIIPSSCEIESLQNVQGSPHDMRGGCRLLKFFTYFLSRQLCGLHNHGLVYKNNE